ncbi:hypothetical protein T492DRAFT_1095548 [Pavlovales sp. CCMP2436]|nr:hypothetical protein T492DRAFT_1095548 [Pavlovales sp. CCMP2436]|mmetsp:Transcript_12413/g.31416  ORF Transcript_12413/g.31416 Transcript_12413/m.31416 type:complete len:244 (-) Transcript_12413:144-875(-)
MSDGDKLTLLTNDQARMELGSVRIAHEADDNAKVYETPADITAPIEIDPALGVQPGLPDDIGDLPIYDDAAKLQRDRQMLGAGIAGTSVSLLLTGNVLIAAAVGAGAVYATTQEGKVGNVARSVGDKTMRTVDRVRAVMREHNVPERAKAAAAAAATNARELDQRLRLRERASAAASDVAGKLRSFTKQPSARSTKGVLSPRAAAEHAEHSQPNSLEAGTLRFETFGEPVDKPIGDLPAYAGH